ncbi:hypothetical protein ES288_D04G139700v1 [Gossypium darwinii]|uniref:Peptidase A2 domain-containing protein n=1 Tax=Gossypium darwinii TaxID=34276 RepID=A0A5D2CZ45_GOSDA|nr:hypothetical protein ES288_D04G139700v1 [Gossypium darwinii]
MMVSAKITGFEVKRILVDSGSAVEVLSWGAYKEMGLKGQSLSVASPLYSFVNHPVEVRGTVTLAVTLGDVEHTTIECVQFYVVNHSIAYNAIFGRPIMRMINMVMTTYCIKIKFPTSTGVGYLRSN